MIAFKIGDVVPADCRLTESINVSIDRCPYRRVPAHQQEGWRPVLLSLQFCFLTTNFDFSGSTLKVSEVEGVVIATGANTFFGRAASLVGQNDDTTSHLQAILAHIGSFCLIAIGSFCLIAIGIFVLKIVILYPAFHYTYRRGFDNILVLLIGGIPIAMPIVLSVTPEDVTLLASSASRNENQDTINACVVGMLDDPKKARTGIKLLDFKPFSPVNRFTKITYREEATGRLKRATKGMTGKIIELCTRNKTDNIENRIKADELDHDDHKGEGNGFELIGLLAIFNPPREDTKQTIDDALAPGIKVKMVTGDQLAIAKEPDHRLGLSDHMSPAKVLKEGPTPGSRHATLDEMIMDADGFAGVFPEHKYEIVKRLQGLGHLCAMTGGGANDAPALSCANIGIAVDGATDAARGAADIVSTIVHAICGSRVIF
ncbi:plasma membrane H+-ATPase [Tulasnella sp. 427]|nr:plasma membrane H+-ATPase [Tulasnella sp. 427]